MCQYQITGSFIKDETKHIFSFSGCGFYPFCLWRSDVCSLAISPRLGRLRLRARPCAVVSLTDDVICNSVVTSVIAVSYHQFLLILKPIRHFNIVTIQRQRKNQHDFYSKKIPIWVRLLWNSVLVILAPYKMN